MLDASEATGPKKATSLRCTLKLVGRLSLFMRAKRLFCYRQSRRPVDLVSAEEEI